MASEALQVEPGEHGERDRSPLDLLADISAERERYDDSSFEQQEVSAALRPRPPHVLPEDSGTIRCICPYIDDDGFTIQCDGCYAWQHAMCVDVDADDVPERYMCHLCQPRVLNVQLATVRQQRRLMGEDSRALLSEAAEQRSQELERQEMTEEDNWDARTSTAEGSRLGSPAVSKEQVPARPSAPSPVGSLVAHGKRRSLAGQDEAGPSPPAAKRKRSNKPIEVKGDATPPIRRRESRMQQTIVTQWSAVPVTPAEPYFDESTAWKREYTHVEGNTWVDAATVALAAAACEMGEPEERIVVGNMLPMGRATFKRRKRKVADPPRASWKAATGSVSMPPGYEELSSLFVGPLSPFRANSEPPPVAIEVRPIPPHMPAVLTPLSVAPFAGPMTGNQPSQACPFPRAPTYGVFLDADVEAGELITEYAGEIVSLATLRADPSSQYGTMGVRKPFIRACPYPWSLAIDARRYGNETRFIRSTCHPNAVVRPLIIKGRNGEIGLHFGVFALFDMTKDDEVLLGWDWDDSHLIHMLPALFGLPSPSSQAGLPEDMDTIDYSEAAADIVTTLLGVTTCACDKRKDCAVGWFYKLAQVTQTTPRGGMTLEQAFEQVVLAATGGADVTVKKKDKRSPKLPNLGPFVGLRRHWEKPEPRKKKGIKIKEDKPVLTKKALPQPAVEVVPPTAPLVEEEPLSTVMPDLFAQPLQAEPDTMPLPEPSLAPPALDNVEPDEGPSMLISDGADLSATAAAVFEPEEESREPSPPKEPTPPPVQPSPPKQKLSLAAYRQRMAERKVEEEAAQVERAEAEAESRQAALEKSVDRPEVDADLDGAPVSPGFIPLDLGDDEDMSEGSIDGRAMSLASLADDSDDVEILPDPPAPQPQSQQPQVTQQFPPARHFPAAMPTSYFPSLPTPANVYASAHSPSPEPEYRTRPDSFSLLANLSREQMQPLMQPSFPERGPETARRPSVELIPPPREPYRPPERNAAPSFATSTPMSSSYPPRGGDWQQRPVTPPNSVGADSGSYAPQQSSPPTGPRADRGPRARGAAPPPAGPRGGNSWQGNRSQGPPPAAQKGFMSTPAPARTTGHDNGWASTRPVYESSGPPSRSYDAPPAGRGYDSGPSRGYDTPSRGYDAPPSRGYDAPSGRGRELSYGTGARGRPYNDGPAPRNRQNSIGNRSASGHDGYHGGHEGGGQHGNNHRGRGGSNFRGRGRGGFRGH